MARLDTVRQEKIEPRRMQYVIGQLKDMGYEPKEITEKNLRFKFKGHDVLF